MAVSLFESEFEFSNPNFSYEIAVSLFESEFKFSNPNFSYEIAVSLFESEFKFSNPKAKIRRQVFAASNLIKQLKK